MNFIQATVVVNGKPHHYTNHYEFCKKVDEIRHQELKVDALWIDTKSKHICDNKEVFFNLTNE